MNNPTFKGIELASIKFSQMYRILWFMQKGGTLTKLEAVSPAFGCGNLSNIVYRLRKKGYDIKREWVKNASKFGEKKFAEYSLNVKGCDCMARCSCECLCGAWDGVDCDCWE